MAVCSALANGVPAGAAGWLGGDGCYYGKDGGGFLPPNQWIRTCFDPVTGNPFVTENGPESFDEINQIEEGAKSAGRDPGSVSVVCPVFTIVGDPGPDEGRAGEHLAVLVDDEERVVGVRHIGDVADLLHHLAVDREATGGVDDEHVAAQPSRLLQPGSGHGHGVGGLAEHGDARLFAEHAQLLDGRRPANAVG